MEEYRKRLELYSAMIAGDLACSCSFMKFTAEDQKKMIDLICTAAVALAKKVIKEVDADIESSKQNV